MPLGKNLENILGDYFGDQGIDLNSTATQIVEIEITKINRNPHQTRKHFETSKIKALAKNIETNGLINPITVLKDAKGVFTLLAGERRLRAFQELKKDSIPAIIKDVKKLTENDKFLISASENLQREALNPIELARTFRILMDTNDWGVKEMAASIGSSMQHVLNYLNLLNLHAVVQEALTKNIIGEAHARRLGWLPLEKQPEFLERVIQQKLSMRELTDLVNEELKKNNKPAAHSKWINKMSPQVYKGLEKWSDGLPKAKVNVKGDDKRGKAVITWGGYSE